MSTDVQQDRAVEAALAKEGEGAEQPAEVEMHDDKTREMRTPGFTRMRFEWAPQDQSVITMIKQRADDHVAMAFTGCYQILNDIYGIVRQQAADEKTGELLTDRHGWPVWAKTPSGRFIEDYEQLGHKERENFLFQIATHMFDWEQKQAEAWAEAMFAKAQWEERYAISFTDDSLGGRKTDEAMTQRARTGSREERYFALYESAISRKIDALVKSMDRIQQRLKDSLYT